MATYPKVNLTINITATRPVAYNEKLNGPVSALDAGGGKFVQEELSYIVDALFGSTLDSFEVTARHELVEAA